MLVASNEHNVTVVLNHEFIEVCASCGQEQFNRYYDAGTL
jgi:hypothetical protein